MLHAIRLTSLTLLVGTLACSDLVRAATVVDFEDVLLPTTTSAGNFYNGNDDAGGFVSRGVAFNNAYTPPAEPYPEYWTGWAASNSADTKAAGFTNQYSAYPGSGALGSSNFGVANDSSFGPSVVTFPQPTEVTGAYLTNGTYAALSMLHGDDFTKKFGGATGNDPDWFKLEIFGKDHDGSTTGMIDFYLADFRFGDDSQDYVVDEWTWIDLTSLGTQVESLEFELTSSDNSMFGMNTPSYFLFDNLSVTGTFDIDADFNGDMSVDSVDLETWQKNYSAITTATRALGDSDGDFDVDGQDFLNWQRQLDVPVIGLQTAGVPEPTSIALLACGFGLLAYYSFPGSRLGTR